MEKKTDIRKFILENHDQFTVGEIADMLKAKSSRVSLLLDELGVKCITKADKHKRFMKDNPGLTIKELSEVLNISEVRIYAYKKELGQAIVRGRSIGEFNPSPVEQEGLLEIAACVFEGITDEQKKIFAQKYVERRRTPGVIRSDYL